MFDFELEECLRFADVHEDDNVILFDVGVNIMDLEISEVEVDFISPLSSGIVIEDFTLKNGIALDYDVDGIEAIDNIIMNNRLPNKRYTTLSAKDGRKRCKEGFPIVIPKNINTEDCMIEFKFNAYISESMNICLSIVKNLNLKMIQDIEAEVAKVDISFFKDIDDFQELIDNDEILNLSKYELKLHNSYKQNKNECGTNIIESYINPENIDIIEIEDKTTIHIQFYDDKDIQTGYIK